MPVARKVLGWRQHRREDQAAGVHTAFSGFPRRLPLTSPFASSNHNTLPGTAQSTRIQISKNAGDIL